MYELQEPLKSLQTTSDWSGDEGSFQVTGLLAATPSHKLALPCPVSLAETCPAFASVWPHTGSSSVSIPYKSEIDKTSHCPKPKSSLLPSNVYDPPVSCSSPVWPIMHVERAIHRSSNAKLVLDIWFFLTRTKVIQPHLPFMCCHLLQLFLEAGESIHFHIFKQNSWKGHKYHDSLKWKLFSLPPTRPLPERGAERVQLFEEFLFCSSSCLWKLSSGLCF